MPIPKSDQTTFPEGRIYYLEGAEAFHADTRCPYREGSLEQAEFALGYGDAERAFDAETESRASRGPRMLYL